MNPETRQTACHACGLHRKCDGVACHERGLGGFCDPCDAMDAETATRLFGPEDDNSIDPAPSGHVACALAFDHGRLTEEAATLWHAYVCGRHDVLTRLRPYAWRRCVDCRRENPYRIQP